MGSSGLLNAEMLLVNSLSTQMKMMGDRRPFLNRKIPLKLRQNWLERKMGRRAKRAKRGRKERRIKRTRKERKGKKGKKEKEREEMMRRKKKAGRWPHLALYLPLMKALTLTRVSGRLGTSLRTSARNTTAS